MGAVIIDLVVVLRAKQKQEMGNRILPGVVPMGLDLGELNPESQVLEI